MNREEGVFPHFDRRRGYKWKCFQVSMDPPREIPPNPPRWQPNPDPSSINIPGLDTGAPVLDQIEQIEQLITIKLQVKTWSGVLHVSLADLSFVRTEHR